ncbi:MAG: hypothetical protein Kow006_27040 [Gammaproteobacteria bacterium]
MKLTAPSSLAAILLLTLLTGCESWVHKIDVQQGNTIDAEAIEKLKPGLNKKQVVFLLGSPAIRDPFHADRWDYLYYLKPGRGEVRLNRLTVYFEGDRVSRIERPTDINPSR